MSAFSDPTTEALVVGGLLTWTGELPEAAKAVLPEDFHDVGCRNVYCALLSLHGRGERIDLATTGAELRRLGYKATVSRLPPLQADGVHPRAEHYRIIAGWADKRRVYALGSDLVDAAQDPTKDAAGILDAHRSALVGLDLSSVPDDAGDLLVEDFLAQGIAERAPWVIPGIVRRDWRLIVTAPEGYGKSTLLRQFAVRASHGIHPFTPGFVDPVPVLLVDLENPDDVIYESLSHLDGLAKMAATGRQLANLSLWSRPGGIDLRSRKDRATFADVLARHRPQIVVLGPLYKAYTRRSNESDEQVASEVQAVLDDLRTRFGFALIMEHHAAKSSGPKRDLQPFGSSLWLRWPEVGIKLIPTEKHDGTKPVRMTIGRWRGDRSKTAWPDRIDPSPTWPWAGYWENGAPSDPTDPGPQEPPDEWASEPGRVSDDIEEF